MLFYFSTIKKTHFKGCWQGVVDRVSTTGVKSRRGTLKRFFKKYNA